MVVHRAMLKRIYDWCIDAAHKPYALWIMGAVSFAESSFFPIPPDVMLVPMVLANRSTAWFYAAIATVASVLGGIAGYAIGYFLYETLGQWLITAYGLGAQFEAYRAAYNEWGLWIILVKGLTPIPYKLVTIASGFAAFNFPLFVLCAVITRGARFFLLSWLLKRWGEPVQAFIEKRLTLVGWLLLATIIGGATFAVAIHCWYGRHPSELASPEHDPVKRPEINFSSMPVAGNMGGLIFMAGSTAILFAGLPHWRWFFGVALIGGFATAGMLFAWHATHAARRSGSFIVLH